MKLKRHFSVFVVLLLSLLLVAESVWSSSLRRAYRSDPRVPDDVFATGFIAPKDNDSVLDHILGKTPKAKTTAFISTTESSDFLVDKWALDGLYDKPELEFIYIYSIEPRSNFYNAYDSLMKLSKKYVAKADKSYYKTTAERFKHQQEWFAVGRIPGDTIISAAEYRRNDDPNVHKLVYVKRIKNPNYVSEGYPHHYEPYIEKKYTRAGASSSDEQSSCFPNCIPKSRRHK